MAELSYETFYKNFLSSCRENVNLRTGQLFMNELCKHNPKLYKKVPADLDCFYNDKLFGACSDWVQDRWEDNSALTAYQLRPRPSSPSHFSP